MKYKIENGRCVALKDFGNVKAGDVGGHIESEHNLSQQGDCWVYYNARVFDNAKVYGNAEVFGNAEVCDNTKVYGSSRVNGYAEVLCECSKTPINIIGLRWLVTITDNHITIGCQTHTKEQWSNFTDDEIMSMDENALEFWNENKKRIL